MKLFKNLLLPGLNDLYNSLVNLTVMNVLINRIHVPEKSNKDSGRLFVQRKCGVHFDLSPDTT